jgi:hypothetical protein
LPAYCCPSDPTQTGDPFYGPGNYATNNLLLRRRTRLGAEDFPNGLSETVLFAEKYAACSYWALTQGEPVPWYAADPTSGFQTRPTRCDPALPQTPHRAGIQAALADGSVRLMATGVSPASWYAAHSLASAGESDWE